MFSATRCETFDGREVLVLEGSQSGLHVLRCRLLVRKKLGDHHLMRLGQVSECRSKQNVHS